MSSIRLGLRQPAPKGSDARGYHGPPFHCPKSIEQRGASTDEAHHPDPLPQRGGDAPGHARRPAARVEGFDEVEWLVIDDGSTDRTVEVARDHGVDHVVRLTNNKGLAAAFQAGLDACLKLGADVIVNTDADNQYRAADIAQARRADPRRRGRHGRRRPRRAAHRALLALEEARFSGSAAGSCGGPRARTSPTRPPAFAPTTARPRCSSRSSSNFTYTLESLIQAGKMLVAVDQVPIETNPTDRESRLFPSTWHYVRRNALAIFRVYALYEPLRVFTVAAVVLAIAALAAWTPFLADWILNGDSQRPHPVADPRRRALHRRGAAVRPRRDRRPPRRTAGDDAAGVRAGQTRRARLGVEPSHYEPGTPQPQRGPVSNSAEPDATAEDSAGGGAGDAAGPDVATPAGRSE